MIAVRVANNRDDLLGVVAVSNPTQRGATVEIQLPRPAIFLTGDRDEYSDGRLLEGYREQIGPNVTVTVFSGVDHFWWGSDDRLAEAATAFLRSL
jgi:alpha/beta superfamily hydrolase